MSPPFESKFCESYEGCVESKPDNKKKIFSMNFKMAVPKSQRSEYNGLTGKTY